MVRKNSVLAVLLVMTSALVTPAFANASGQCGEALVKICVGCHESDRFCERLGAPDKEWRALINRMVANGAELEKEEVGALAACLSEPATGANKLCGK